MCCCPLQLKIAKTWDRFIGVERTSLIQMWFTTKKVHSAWLAQTGLTDIFFLFFPCQTPQPFYLVCLFFLQVFGPQIFFLRLLIDFAPSN